MYLPTGWLSYLEYLKIQKLLFKNFRVDNDLLMSQKISTTSEFFKEFFTTKFYYPVSAFFFKTIPYSIKRKVKKIYHY